ncbi:MAG: glycosyltransferase family 39 protein [Bacteroidetes bacterium]|nr:glycosyltransferase family 39 protein [Bacteroidota bacterium]
MPVNLKYKLSVKIKEAFAVILFLAALFWFYDYVGIFEVMKMRPCSVHLWPQCERGSIALNYSNWDMNFFLPRIHKFEHGNEGITGMEFPLVQYIPAICYKLFGFNEIYYRGFVLLSIVFGLCMFYRLMYSVNENYFVSIGLTAAASLSPALVFYSNNFMPDVTSLGFVLAAWFYFFKFLKGEGNSKLHYRVYWILMVLAILIKITSFISLTAVLGLVILDLLNFFKKTTPTGSLFSRSQKLIIFRGYVLSVILVAAWYLYARWLTQHYKTEGFLLSQTILTNWQDFIDIWDYIYKIHLYEYFTYEGYIHIAVLICVLIIAAKFVSRLYFTITLLLLVGDVLFIYLFFSQFQDHEYYIIALLPFVFFLALSFADLLKRISIKFSTIITYVVIIFLFFSVKESVRACKRDYFEKYQPKYIRWVSDFESYWDLEPKLRKLGVKKTDYTLAGFDMSFCNSLYLMDQLGYSFDENIQGVKLKALMENPRYKYLVISDSAKFNKMYPNNLQNSILTTHRGLIVYKLN